MSTKTTNNRLSETITAAMIQQAKDSLNTLNSTFDFLIGLTPEERQSILKIDGSNKVFVEDALADASNNTNVLPAYLKLDEMRKDLEGYHALDEIVTLSAQFAERIRDTQMLMGSEAYASALTVYRLFESAARDAVPGADAIYQHLRTRFAGQGTPSEPAADAAPKGAT